MRKLALTALALLVSLAAIMLLLSAVSPSLLDPRNIAAWRKHRAATGPMEFYAKVVDESGGPVEGAKVTLRLNLHNSGELIGQGFVREEAVTLYTDVNGLAVLDGHTGFDIVVVDVAKPGYRWYYDADRTHRSGEPLTDMRGFHYGDLLTRYIPDPNNPAVFPLYREGVTSPEPGVGDAALPSRGGSTGGIRGEPFVPRISSLERDR
jgi:hypothetical protein